MTAYEDEPLADVERAYPASATSGSTPSPTSEETKK